MKLRSIELHIKSASALVCLGKVGVLDIRAIALHSPVSAFSWVAGEVGRSREVAVGIFFDGLGGERLLCKCPFLEAHTHEDR